jgi:creatinine amidohydrolase
MEANFSNERALELTPQTWRWYKHRAPGGPLSQLAIHQFDVLHYLGGDIVEASSMASKLSPVGAEVDDQSMTLIRFADGKIGYVGACWTSPGIFAVRVFGSKGLMHYEIDFGTWDTPEQLHQSSTLYIQRGKDGYAKREELKVPESDMFRAELDLFAASCRSGKGNELSADNGNIALAVVYAALRSIEENGRSIRLADVIAAQFKKNPLVILPAGSVEQHGPHLPTGTDTLAANMIAQRVAELMDGLVLPATPLGVTPMHMPFEGTITLTPDTYMRVVIETCASTAKHGARYLMLMNWHEGNIPSLAIAAEALHRIHGMTVLTVQACYVAEELYGGSCNGLTHGGEIEALAVLANRPELVHLDRIENSSDHSHGHRMDKLRRTRSYQPVLTDIRSIAPTGWFGAPQHANTEKGHRMVGEIADAITREAAAIFRQLDAVQGGSAELKQLRQVG